MRWSFALLVVAACGSKPPSEATAVPRLSPNGTRISQVPRPAIELPSMTLRGPIVDALDLDDVRWPLLRHPVVEPHADLAAIYRGSGSWRDLCTARGEPRWVDRDEALAYLAAWCAHATDAAPTRQRLEVLARGKSPKIAKAARADIIDLLAGDSLTASKAIEWLAVRRLDDTEQLDALAATYLLLDKDDFAAVVIQSLRLRRPSGSAADRCRRLVRDYTVTNSDVLGELDKLAADSTCARLVSIVRPTYLGSCPLQTHKWPEATCREHGCEDLVDHLVVHCGGLIPKGAWGQATWIAAVETWPVFERRAAIWIEYARFASGVIEEPGAVRLVAAALENAALLADCSKDVPAIVALATAAKAQAPENPVLAHLVTLTSATCAKRFSPTIDGR